MPVSPNNKLALYPRNALIGSLITPTGVVAGFGVERLCDDAIGRECRDSSNSGTRRWVVDRGAGSLWTIDTWLEGPGHNLSGITVTVDSSPDGLDPWTQRGTFDPVAGVAFITALTPSTDRWWRKNAPSPAAPPVMTEWVLSQKVQVTYGPSDTSFRDGELPNAQLYPALSGLEHAAELGPSRWMAEYLIRDLGVADRALLAAAWAEVRGGVRPLFIQDADGVLRFVRWANADLGFDGVPASLTRRNVRLQFREQIGSGV